MEPTDNQEIEQPEFQDAPTWYTPENAFALMEQATSKGHHLREFWAEQLNLAFEKGKQIGFDEAAEMADGMKEGFGIRLNDVEAELHKAQIEIERLKQFKLAYMEWSEKTNWVQKKTDWSFPCLGMHRADVMKKEIERLQEIEFQYDSCRH